MIRSERDIRADKILWFAMSTGRRPVMHVKAELEAEGLTTYVAMHYVLEEKSGAKKKVLKPALNNLVFVHTRKSIIQIVKSKIRNLCYMVRPVEGHNIPIVISDEEMGHFMSVTSQYNENFLFISPLDDELQKGARVRVLKGPFTGAEGIFVKHKGSRKRRLVVVLETLAAVSVEVSPEDIEIVTHA